MQGEKYVLASSGCYNKIPQAGELVSNRNLFLTVLEPRSRQQIPCLVRASFTRASLDINVGSEGVFSLGPHIVEGAGSFVCITHFSVSAVIPLMRAPPS